MEIIPHYNPNKFTCQDIKKYDSTATKYRKCDPLELFEAYKKNWGKMRIPGEAKHLDLRWRVRDMVLSDQDLYQRVTFFSKWYECVLIEPFFLKEVQRN